MCSLSFSYRYCLVATALHKNSMLVEWVCVCAAATEIPALTIDMIRIYMLCLVWFGLVRFYEHILGVRSVCSYHVPPRVQSSELLWLLAIYFISFVLCSVPLVSERATFFLHSSNRVCVWCFLILCMLFQKYFFSLSLWFWMAQHMQRSMQYP